MGATEEAQARGYATDREENVPRHATKHTLELMAPAATHHDYPGI